MKNFTLIELLVVVAIIGILASLLLPSLEKAREKAKIAVEVSNRKQLYIATISYSTNNRGLLPDRGSPVPFLHILEINALDLNRSFLDLYLDESQETRTEIMFCDSNLFEVRGPQANSLYQNQFCTLNYYQIPSNGTLLDSEFNNERISSAMPDNALWSCMSLYKTDDGKWFGHNAPVTQVLPKGASTVFIDGGAKWMHQSSSTALWDTGGFQAFTYKR